MAGIRIHHPTLRNCKLLVKHPGNPLTGRKAKDYHITIDAEGDTIVSETVWMRLQEAKKEGFDGEFIVLNEVPDPPTLVLSNRSQAEQLRTFRIDEDRVLREIAPPGVTPRVANVPHTGGR